MYLEYRLKNFYNLLSTIVTFFVMAFFAIFRAKKVKIIVQNCFRKYFICMVKQIILDN